MSRPLKVPRLKAWLQELLLKAFMQLADTWPEYTDIKTSAAWLTVEKWAIR